MMRVLLMIILMFVGQLAMGQVEVLPGIDTFDWSKIEVSSSRKMKMELLDRTVSTDFFIVGGYFEYDSSRIDDYHILDFNADGLNDLVYDGRNPPGTETNNLAFFLNDSDSLRLVIKLNGDFMDMDFDEKGKIQRFGLLYSPCCADVVLQGF